MNTTELLEVNDDCLMVILRYLSSISETCLRLRAIAMREFSLNHSVLNLSLYRLTHIRRILMNFGGLINELIPYSIRLGEKPREQSKECYYLITRYCGSNLKSLRMDETVFNVLIAPKLRRLFSCVERLTIIRPKFIIPNSSFLFSECNNLKELIILHPSLLPNYNFYFNFKMPHLESLKLGSCILDYNSTLKPFIENHKKLKCLEVYLLQGIQSLFTDISKHLKQLEKLTIRFSMCEGRYV